MFARVLIAFALGVLATSCRDVEPGAPVLASMTPALGANEASVRATIRGEHLVPRLHTDFQRRANSGVDASYTAALGAIALQDVALAGEGALEATVPAGLAPGSYDLTVTDPWGRTATLAAAFRAYDRWALDGFAFAPIGAQEAATPFSVTISAVNAAGEVIPGYVGSAALSDGTGTLVPTATGAFAAGEWTGTVAVDAPAASDTLTAADGACSGQSNAFAVQPRAPASLSFVTAARTARAGECSAAVTVQLLDDRGQVVPARSALALTVSSTGLTGVSFFSDSSCQAAGAPQLAQGDTSLTFYFRGTVVGTGTISASDTSLGSVSQAASVVAGPPTHIVFLGAPQSIPQGSCSAAELMELRDAFENVAVAGVGGLIVNLSASPGGLVFSSDACVTAVTSIAFPASSSQASFRFNGGTPGSYVITAADGGTLSGTQNATIAAPAIVEGPFVQAAVAAVNNRIRVYFSRDMRADSPTVTASATNPANYCVEDFSGSLGLLACAAGPTGDFSVASVARIDGRTYDLVLAGGTLQQYPKRYTVYVSPSVTDSSGTALVSPIHAELQMIYPVSPDGIRQLRLELARSLGPNTVELTFNGPLATVGSGNVNCTTNCTDFLLVGPTSLGAIQSVQVSATNNHQAILTHEFPQLGRLYTVIGANGDNTDGFPETSGAIEGENASTLQNRPFDRAPFLGNGTPIAALGSAPFAVNPFGDVTRFSTLFAFKGRVFLGADKLGVAAIRLWPTGADAERLHFRFYKDVNGFGSTSSNSSSADFYPSIGSSGCTANTPACGPDNENARGTIAPVRIQGADAILMGGANTSAVARYAYMSFDDDRELDLRYADVSPVIDPSARAFTAIGSAGGRIYLGLSASALQPHLLNISDLQFLGASGLEPTTNEPISANKACGNNDACYLDANEMPGVGGARQIDFITEYSGRVYLGNAGGLVRSTVGAPESFAARPGDWTTNATAPVAITPSASQYLDCTSVTPAAFTDVTPQDRTWLPVVEYQGHLFTARNVQPVSPCGPQLWKCSPGGGPDPLHCDAGDWTLIAIDTINGRTSASSFNDSQNLYVTLLAKSGPSLYVGYDNMSTGVAVFRTSVADPVLASDFRGLGGCTAGVSGCKGLGDGGFGLPGQNRQILSFVAVTEGIRHFLYVATGDLAQSSVPVRVYRQED